MTDEKHLGAHPRHGGRETSAPHPAPDAASHAAHTPGPWAWEWIAEKSNEWAVGQAWREDGTPISGQIVEGEWLEDTIIERRLIGMNESGHANAADAHLIAAAPDLLAALKVIRDQTFVDAEGPELRAQNECNHRRAVEAIQKAEGR